MVKDHKSALVVIPPEELWDAIQQVRKEHDKAYNRWMPHINMLYPFVPESENASIIPRLESVISSTPKFEVTFSVNSISHFQHGRKFTLVLLPQCVPSAALQDLEQRLV